MEHFEGYYEVSDLGRIKQLEYYDVIAKRWVDEKIINQSLGKRSNYYTVVLYDEYGNKHWKSVHSIVANSFCEGYKDGLVVNHKDLNKLNNDSGNLEFITHKENIQHYHDKQREILH
ncbi:hypothetical protein COM83_32090 [Bacillus cereus]|nr:hypothetical protein COM83_32090 [Bacillus cereus]PFJ45214.1 hypothetical protein COI99_28460 [Bacillus cereus]PFW08789.1 hypothetical protein COL18_26620 [Bacillus cereus]PGW92604.1 hypothetical protein COE40_30055 [Bacillus cereus]PGY15585.1 hypothetical protein COE16_26395 [Bacillus cereus]